MDEAGVSWMRVAAFAAMLSIGAAARAEERIHFELALERKGFPDFDQHPVIDGPPGSVHLIDVELLIEPTGFEESSVQGWSLAVWHAGMDLISTSIEDTVSADKEDGGLVDLGFRIYQVIDPAQNGGKRGVVQAVVLSHVRTVVLEPEKAHVVGRHVYRAQVGEQGVGAFVRYEDRLTGRGQPVDNVATVRGSSRSPSLDFREITIGTNVAPEAGACADGIDNDLDTWTDCADPDCRDIAACGFELCHDGIDNDLDSFRDCRDSDCMHVESCREDCDDGRDNEGDGVADCDDSECFPVSPCRVPEDCGDGLDNDRDGVTDCMDPECRGIGDCPGPEICGDNVDNDLDGLLDCEDFQCFGILPCLGFEVCGDGIDNNGDQKADCDDPQCFRSGSCVGIEDCDDGADNDGDGKIDCDDPQCGGNPPCPQLEICGDGSDNDGDQKTDCDDPQCTAVPPCPGPEDCHDRFDNDLDGAVDCDDPDCAANPEICPPREDCSDGVDNDADLRVDCDDPGCRGDLACPSVEICNDGFDNDQDGRADCDDADCAGTAACDASSGFDLVLTAAGSRFEGGRSVLELEESGDGKVDLTVYIVPFPGAQPAGAQGWSIGVAHEHNRLGFDPEGGAPTFAGTDAERLFDAGFQKTEQARRLLGADQTDGFVSAIVLSFTQPVTLDPLRAQSVARAGYRVLGGPAGAVWSSTLIRFLDGLRGSGQPISNRLTVLGQSVDPVHILPLLVRLGTVAGSFVRGDANGDHKVDIADAVWCVNELLRHGPASRCQRAADINDDGLYDLSDVMYLITWEFLSGPGIPEPFPGCAAAFGPSELECPEGSVPYCGE